MVGEVCKKVDSSWSTSGKALDASGSRAIAGSKVIASPLPTRCRSVGVKRRRPRRAVHESDSVAGIPNMKTAWATVNHSGTYVAKCWIAGNGEPGTCMLSTMAA